MLKIIQENIHLKTDDIVWLAAIKKYNQSTSYVLVLIEKARNTNQ